MQIKARLPITNITHRGAHRTHGETAKELPADNVELSGESPSAPPASIATDQERLCLSATHPALPGPAAAALKVAFFDVEDWHLPIIEEQLQDSEIEVLHTQAEHLDPQSLEQMKGAEALSIFFSPISAQVKINFRT